MQPPTIDPSELRRRSPGRLAVRVRPSAERAIRSGHPWLFQEAITSVDDGGEPGDVAVVLDRDDHPLASGLYDPESPIRVRLLLHGGQAEIGQALFRGRIAEALGHRGNVASAQTTAFRVLNGGGDRMPGLVADLYDRTLVLQAFSSAWLLHMGDVVAAFEQLLAPERVLLLVGDLVARGEACPPLLRDGAVLRGSDAPDGIAFLETGLRFRAHPFRGHKTGFYLDQRANRRRVGRESAGARVLNLFSYTGGFSLHAARGGALEVVSVDQAAPALAQAERHFELNRADAAVSACRHRTIEGDAFEVMARMAEAGESFDVVVVDPPSFARAARHRSRALGAYRALTRLAVPLVRSGGLLVQASCSSRIGAGEFQGTVEDEVRRRGRSADAVEYSGHAPDHPTRFPEGEYLKCVWARLA